MAETAITTVLAKVAELVAWEAAVLLEVGDDVRLLRDKLEWLHTFIRDADRRRRLRDDEFVAVWVRQTRDVAFEAEDALNDFLRHDLLARVRQIRKRLEKISANRAAYHIEHAASPAWAVSSATTLAAWRYLVVVDGSIAVADWNSLRASLLDEGNGSRVALVTDAAGLEVVGYAGGLTYDPIELTRLSPENTYELFRRRVR